MGVSLVSRASTPMTDKPSKAALPIRVWIIMPQRKIKELTLTVMLFMRFWSPNAHLLYELELIICLLNYTENIILHTKMDC